MIIPEFRWNLYLFAYVPTMSGLWFDFEWAFEGIRRAYINFEYSAFPSLFENEEIGIVTKEDYSWDKFVQVSNNLRKPVVFRGVFSDSQAVKEFGTDEWVSKYNGFKIQTVKNTSGTFKYDYDLEERDFDEFISNLKSGKFEYGYGLDEIYYKYPELTTQLGLEEIKSAQASGPDSNFCQSLALFVGGTGVGLRWHNANHANIGIMLTGSKRFHLIDAKYSFFMGPDGNRDPYSTGFAARSPHSIISQLPETIVDINAGDAIYLPPWQWHAVETYADEKRKVAMLNTCRFGKIFQSIQNAAPLELYRHQGFINWLHPKLPVAARFVPYMRVIQDGIREITGTMPKWDTSDCYSSKKKACETYFKSVGWL